MVGKQGFWVIIRQYEGGKIRSVVGLICLVVVVVVLIVVVVVAVVVVVVVVF